MLRYLMPSISAASGTLKVSCQLDDGDESRLQTGALERRDLGAV